MSQGQEPAKRKRRTKAEMEADAAAERAATGNAQFAAPQGGDTLEIPPFLDRRPPGMETENPAPQFGMEEPQDPDAALLAALDNAMKLPT
jgi:hypothetical protein